MYKGMNLPPVPPVIGGGLGKQLNNNNNGGNGGGGGSFKLGNSSSLSNNSTNSGKYASPHKSNNNNNENINSRNSNREELDASIIIAPPSNINNNTHHGNLESATNNNNEQTAAPPPPPPAQVIDEELQKQIELLPDVTVKEYLESIRDSFGKKIMEHAEAQVNTLKKEFEREKKRLLDLAVEVQTNNKKQKKDNQIAIKGKKLGLKIISEIRKDMMEQAKYPLPEGLEYFVDLHPNKPIRLGRSSGQEFRKKEVSIHWDSEVSTTHGVFSLSVDGATLTFTDTGSTNGTKVDLQGKFQESNDKTAHPLLLLKKDKPQKLKVGDVLVVGATTLRVVKLE